MVKNSVRLVTADPFESAKLMVEFGIYTAKNHYKVFNEWLDQECMLDDP